jgi:4-alpha-glucanotransferase
MDFVAYSGTHDNDTTIGWLNSLNNEEKLKVQEYLGQAIPDAWHLIREAEASVAQLAILPMQDLLGLPSSARMNKPGTIKNNWIWRMKSNQSDKQVAARLRRLTELYGRLG